MRDIMTNGSLFKLQDAIVSIQRTIDEVNGEIGELDQEIGSVGALVKKLQKDMVLMNEHINKLYIEPKINQDTFSLLKQDVERLKKYEYPLNSEEIKNILDRFSKEIGYRQNQLAGNIKVMEDQLEDTRDEFKSIYEKLKLVISEFTTRDNKTNQYIDEKLKEKTDRIILLEKRLEGLTELEDRLKDQDTRVRVREQQEEDVSRLQRFKDWAKENIAGLSALALSIAGIITTIVIGTRKAIMKGAQATSKFGKSEANLAKKLWPVLGPLRNLVEQAISWGAKGLAWLANNLWVLALAFAWFIYDQYKRKRNKK